MLLLTVFDHYAQHKNPISQPYLPSRCKRHVVGHACAMTPTRRSAAADSAIFVIRGHAIDHARVVNHSVAAKRFKASKD